MIDNISMAGVQKG